VEKQTIQPVSTVFIGMIVFSCRALCHKRTKFLRVLWYHTPIPDSLLEIYVTWEKAQNVLSLPGPLAPKRQTLFSFYGKYAAIRQGDGK